VTRVVQHGCDSSCCSLPVQLHQPGRCATAVERCCSEVQLQIYIFLSFFLTNMLGGRPGAREAPQRGLAPAAQSLAVAASACA
jgi:hypothetical protein